MLKNPNKNCNSGYPNLVSSDYYQH